MLNFRHADDDSTRIRSFSVTYPMVRRAELLPPMAEGWHLLVHAIQGVVWVRASDREWLVPPHRGLWVPEGTACRLEMRGDVALRMLYARSGVRGLPAQCGVVAVGPLLRELIVRANAIGALDARVPEQARLVGVLVDELRSLSVVGKHLPIPNDARGARLVAALDRGAGWDEAVRESGASMRTLERIFMAQTGLSLGRWRRQRLLMTAVSRIADGESIKGAAAELGYASASAFVAMFRREMGVSPARFLR
jgi:AraC-like DNA-binding protein